jgi:hypothetical protein
MFLSSLSPLADGASRFVPKHVARAPPHLSRLRREVVELDLAEHYKTAWSIFVNPSPSPLSPNLSVPLCSSLSCPHHRRSPPVSLLLAVNGGKPESKKKSGRSTSHSGSSWESGASRGGQSWEYFAILFQRSSPESAIGSSTPFPIITVEHTVKFMVSWCIFKPIYCILS